jgi:hypothetical protein
VAGGRTIGRAKERGAGVATTDGHDRRHAQVLDEGAHDRDANRQLDARLDAVDEHLFGRRVRAVERVHRPTGLDSAPHRRIQAATKLVSPQVFVARSVGRRDAKVGQELGPEVGLRLNAGNAEEARRDAHRRTVRDGGPAGVFHARGVERLLKGDVHVLVRLLVVDDNVHVRLGQQLLGVPRVRRHHAVVFADLRRPLEHLHRVGVVGHPAGGGAGGEQVSR